MTVKRNRVFPCLAACFATVLMVLSLSGCGEGIPKGVRQNAEMIPGTIESAHEFVAQQQKKYNQLTGSKEFIPIATAAQKEDWAGKFTQAGQMLSRAQDVYKTELDPLLRKNAPESTPGIQQQIHRIKEIISDARRLSQLPAARFNDIQRVVKNAGRFRDDAGDQAQQIDRIVEQTRSGPFAKAFADFPDHKTAIHNRLAPFLKLAQASQTHLQTVDRQFDLHQAGSGADYAAFTDSTLALSRNHEKAAALQATAEKEIQQLYKSYTKVLKDMKATYHVTVKRESWDENADYYRPKFTTFTREVSPAAYEALTAGNIDSIADITAGFSGSRFSSKIGNTWNNLSINPTDNWPDRYHNAASFWVEDSKESYFHKYILEQDGETTETDWQKVDENFYDANLEFLGMAILAKPYGTFEKDRLTQAAPPGMAYVGNSQYGEWKENESGDRFWSWYGKYAFFSNLFFFPPYYYGYHSWSGWHNNYRYKKPYFGKTQKGFQKFGTNGRFVRQSPAFQNTSFARSGGFRSQTASVRGASAGLRGGGPKGKGK